MKKRLLLTGIVLLYITHCMGQLTGQYNRPRIGDEIIKQQVSFKDPGPAGKNIVWDFSDRTTINDEYSLIYQEAPRLNDSVYILGDYTFNKKEVNPDDLFIGLEHNTMYYYRISNDSLFLLGHENPYVKLTYETPVLSTVFPVNYGTAGSSSSYLSHGLYSASIPIQTTGSMTVQADAYGKMVLSAGDTISPVLRVKTVHILQDADSLPRKIHETYRWYTKGYRYPLFEVLKSTNEDTSPIFSTAFYYPPQDHFYLDTDPDNLALLDELWDENNIAQEEKKTEKDNPEPESPLSGYISYKIYPNPVSTLLTIEYTIKEEVPVSFELFSFDGNVIRKVAKQTYQKGDYTESFVMSGLMKGNYILRITANNEFVNEKIIKE